VGGFRKVQNLMRMRKKAMKVLAMRSLMRKKLRTKWFKAF
jgi:hypothetical protein